MFQPSSAFGAKALAAAALGLVLASAAAGERHDASRGPSAKPPPAHRIDPMSVYRPRPATSPKEIAAAREVAMPFLRCEREAINQSGESGIPLDALGALGLMEDDPARREPVEVWKGTRADVYALGGYGFSMVVQLYPRSSRDALLAQLKSEGWAFERRPFVRSASEPSILGKLIPMHTAVRPLGDTGRVRRLTLVEATVELGPEPPEEDGLTLLCQFSDAEEDRRRQGHVAGPGPATAAVARESVACVPPAGIDVAPGLPCTTVLHRAIPLAPGRFLVVADDAKPMELTLAGAGADRPKLAAYAGSLLDLPDRVRRDIRDAFLDSRSRAGLRLNRSSFEGEGITIPTAAGLVTSHRMLKPHLRDSGVISNEREAGLSRLFRSPQSDWPAPSAARLGASAVVIRDPRAACTRLASYEATTGALTEGLRIRGIADPSPCDPWEAQSNFLFNDEAGRLYLLRSRAGEVHAVDAQWGAQLVGRMHCRTCAATGSGIFQPFGHVRAAAHTPSGALLFADANLLWLQSGTEFVAVAGVPAPIVQIVEVREGEALVIGGAGLERVTLPVTGPR